MFIVRFGCSCNFFILLSMSDGASRSMVVQD